MTGPSGMSPMSFDFDIEAFESTTLSLTGSKSPDWGNMGTNQRCSFTPNFDTTSLQPEKAPTSPQHSYANPTPQTHTNQNSSTCHCFETAIQPARALGNPQTRLPRRPSQIPKSNRLPTRLLPRLSTLLHPFRIHDATPPHVRKTHFLFSSRPGTMQPHGAEPVSGIM